MRRDGRVVNGLLAWVSRDWAGLPVALVLGALGAAGVALGATWARVVGGIVVGAAVLLALGSVRHLVHVARVRAEYPPPGRLVDVGGYRMHVLAEGESATKPTVVWVPGGHAPGQEFHQLHTMLREETRSVLVDRPGSGWSDAGPFPRTTETEALELFAALEGAGLNGPFVLVGHSFGGLLVANAARRRPDLVAGLVLLDPTPPDVVVYGLPNPLLTRSRRSHLWSALRHLFGVHRDGGVSARPADAGQSQTPAKRTVRVDAFRTRSDCAAASIFGELLPTGMARAGWQTVVYDGDLADLRVLLVTPRDLAGGEEVLNAVSEPVEADRLRRFYLSTRSRFLATSTRARRIYSPEGTSHNFPHEVPEFVAGVVRALVEELAVELRSQSNRPAD
ncbi:alpha/beta fold hydrolase [Kitasatospora sp. HPMI-4]|uniref:alpha/beta fold hydrolase n=1 Tax=Kitasatospora sp. HPMI-4 TaxID=3448443 RepID=UPI003F1C79CF